MADTTDNQTQDEWNEETVYGPSTVIEADRGTVREDSTRSSI